MVIVKAQYAGKINGRREERVHAALTRCDVRLFEPVPEVKGKAGFSDLEWTENEEGRGETKLTICVAEQERATRLASELRACGMMVAIELDRGN
jgi:hypothetical protein